MHGNFFPYYFIFDILEKMAWMHCYLFIYLMISSTMDWIWKKEKKFVTVGYNDPYA